MKFEWDENKNIANIRKHKIDFNDLHKEYRKTLGANI